MKLYHFTLIFAVLALSTASIFESRSALSASENDSIRSLDAAFDRACDAAALVLRSSGEELSEELIAKAEAQFVNSLCAYFGVNAFSPEGRTLMTKVPVIAVSCSDGMYVGYICDENGTAVRKWTGLIRYDERPPEEILKTYCADLDINRDTNPLTLEFELPADDAGMFQRNARDSGFAAFYRSPEKTGAGISRYTFASSIAKEAESYYVNISGSGYGSPMYYHVKDCIYRNSECMAFNSRKECAEHGAFCCPVCKEVLF